MANALDMVRVTTRCGYRGSRLTALGVPSRANSAYASSTTTSPGAASQTASITGSGAAAPVGLFGEVRKTSCGPACVIARAAASWSRPKSGSRLAATQPVQGVARLEPERAAPRAAERLEQLLDDLVGPVGRPHVAAG